MLNRRNFLRLGAAVAATGGIVGAGALTVAKEARIKGGMDFSPRTGKQRKAMPSACWQCVSRCPMIGYVEDGRLVKIEGNKATVWASTQTPFRAKDEVAQVLGFPSKNVRVIPPFVGGGFGGKSNNKQVVQAARLAK